MIRQILYKRVDGKVIDSVGTLHKRFNVHQTGKSLYSFYWMVSHQIETAGFVFPTGVEWVTCCWTESSKLTRTVNTTDARFGDVYS